VKVELRMNAQRTFIEASFTSTPNSVIMTPNYSCQSDCAEWFSRPCTLYLNVTLLVTTGSVDYFCHGTLNFSLVHSA